MTVGARIWRLLYPWAAKVASPLLLRKMCVAALIELGYSRGDVMVPASVRALSALTIGASCRGATKRVLW